MCQRSHSDTHSHSHKHFTCVGLVCDLFMYRPVKRPGCRATRCRRGPHLPWCYGLRGSPFARLSADLAPRLWDPLSVSPVACSGLLLLILPYFVRAIPRHPDGGRRHAAWLLPPARAPPPPVPGHLHTLDLPTSGIDDKPLTPTAVSRERVTYPRDGLPVLYRCTGKKTQGGAAPVPGTVGRAGVFVGFDGRAGVFVGRGFGWL